MGQITRSPSPKTSNSPPRVTAVKALVVSVAQGLQGKWEWRPKCHIPDHISRATSNPQHALKDNGVIDSGYSRHMTGNMSYLSDFKELNGGYVAFGDDYSRFTWVFFLATKDETSPILKTSITGLENQLSLKVQYLYCETVLMNRRYIADVAASFQRSQIHKFKLLMSNHYLERLLVLRKSQVKLKCQTRLIIKITKHECLKPLQIKTTFHKKLSINQECQDLRSNPSKDRDLDIGGDQKLKTSTLGEIVSLVKSNKNVNGLRILISYQSMLV
nr:ribonuclease H-like domain-containing protein [Tanacetum cinerariifolium]